MTIYPNKFNKIIMVGWDYDLYYDLLKIKKLSIVGYTSKKIYPKQQVPFKYLGSIVDIKEINKNIGLLLVTEDIKLRRLTFRKFKKNLVTFISSSATVNKKNVQMGSVVYPNVFISFNSMIGYCAKIHLGSQIHHDCSVGDFSIVNPKTVILGNTIIGKNCYIGSNSVIRNKFKIKDNSFIKMGSVVKNYLSIKKIKF
jgi:acetyltransferase-like isoleucine patch superfamily enzyme